MACRMLTFIGRCLSCAVVRTAAEPSWVCHLFVWWSENADQLDNLLCAKLWFCLEFRGHKISVPFTSRLFTARKRSLGQGNIFTPVCHSVHGGGMLSQHALQMVSQHALQEGGVPGLGGSGPGGVCSRGCVPGLGGSAARGGAWLNPPPDDHCCGRYASYWNAFLWI